MESPRSCHLCRFDHEPAAYVDLSWLEFLAQREVPQAVTRSVRARPALSRYLIETMNLGSESGWSQEIDPDGIALLPSESLRDLVMRAGTCLCHPSVRSLVHGEDVRAFIDVAGRPLLMFGLHRAPAIASALTVDTQPVVGGVPLPEQIRRYGMQILASAAAHWDHRVAQRMLLKLPIGWGRGFFVIRSRLGVTRANALMTCVMEEGADADHRAAGRWCTGA